MKTKIVILFGAIAAVTVGYATGAHRISCDSPITWAPDPMDMRLARQYFDNRRKLWIAVYEAVNGRQCEVLQTFAEAMVTEWTGMREWLQ